MKHSRLLLGIIGVLLITMACSITGESETNTDEYGNDEDGGSSQTGPTVVTSVTGNILEKINNSLYRIAGDVATVGSGENANVYRAIPLSVSVSGGVTGIDVSSSAQLFGYATTNNGGPENQRYLVYAVYEIENNTGTDFKSLQSTSNMTRNASNANIRGFEFANVRGDQRVGSNGWISSGALNAGSAGYMLLGPSDMSKTEIDAIASLTATIVTLENTATAASPFTYLDLDGELLTTGYSYTAYSDGIRIFSVGLKNNGPHNFTLDTNWNNVVFLMEDKITFISPLYRDNDGLIESGETGTLSFQPYGSQNFVFDEVIVFYRYGYSD